MNQIFPIDEVTCARFIGMPVCAILRDGTRHFGVISRAAGGRLILNDVPEASVFSTTTKEAKNKAGVSGKTKSKKSPKAGSSDPDGDKAQLSAIPFGGGPFGGFPGSFGLFGGRVALDLAAIALLFLLFI